MEIHCKSMAMGSSPFAGVCVCEGDAMFIQLMRRRRGGKEGGGGGGGKGGEEEEAEESSVNIHYIGRSVA